MITEDQVYKAIKKMKGPARNFGIPATVERLKNAHTLPEALRASVVREAAFDNYYYSVYKKLPESLKVVAKRLTHLRTDLQDEVYHRFLMSLSK